MTLTSVPYAALTQDTEQFRLARIQVQNWGTFAGRFSFDVPHAGLLFTGRSGAGKSTALDAHAALTTPPKWVDFNVAARESDRSSRDRNVMTYVRGAWSKQTGDEGGALVQFLRPGTTWSAMAETYRDASGRVVTLAQVLWVRGKSTSPADVKRRYLVLERDFELAELDVFAQMDFDVRTLKKTVPDASLHEEFTPYQERFRRLLGIDSPNALRLLHKTQSAKNLGDLNAFLREFMLDEPTTFAAADKLVGAFNELNEAYRTVVTAREQVEVLQPAKLAYDDHTRIQQGLAEGNQMALWLDVHAEQVKCQLLDSALADGQTQLTGLHDSLTQWQQREEDDVRTLGQLKEKRHAQGGHLLEQLQNELHQAEQSRAKRLAKQGQFQKRLTALGWAEVHDAVGFAELQQQARSLIDSSDMRDAALSEQRDTLRQDQHQVGQELQTLKADIEVMEHKRSNITSDLLKVREQLAQALRVDEADLPFAGELMEVKAADAPWQGAIERVLRPFALSLLVDDRLYGRVADYVNQTNLRTRLVYLRMTPQADTGRPLSGDSLLHKLTFARTPTAQWVKDEVKARFDYACLSDAEAFRQTPRAVTREGQIKHSLSRHEKDDRHALHDARHWVLGFDNRAKLDLFREQARQCAAKLVELEAAVAKVAAERDQLQARARHAEAVLDTQWEEIDVASVLERLTQLTARLVSEKAARPSLEQLNQDIADQEQRCRQIREEVGKLQGRLNNAQDTLNRLRRERQNLAPAKLGTVLPPDTRAALAERFSQTGKVLSLESLTEVLRLAERQLQLELKKLTGELAETKASVERAFDAFVRKWPAEASGLDATLASAADFFARLDRLEADGLPRYEERFKSLLREHSDQNLTLLATKLDKERKAIRDRMELVNESLATAPFNPGTHLVIETNDRLLEDVRQFKQDLRAALSHSFGAELAQDEARFLRLNALVKRLSSSEPVDRQWQELVLDVRKHVEFVGRELDQDGVEVDVYDSGAGKSGGQRQKLTATCLAAALRYQLGGRDRTLPSFATVVMDEAFDKADAEFTEAAMNIFKTFGFQMVIATPLKSVMTLEPFIGGACFVDIVDRKHSRVTPIYYDEAAQKLRLTPNLMLEDADEARAA